MDSYPDCWDRCSACAVEVLRAETGGLLWVAGNADELVAGESEDAAGIGRDSVVEADAPIVGGEQVHDGRGEGVSPVGIEEVIRVVIGDGELCRQRICCGSILRIALRVTEGY